MSWGCHGQSVLRDRLTSLPCSLTRSRQGLQQHGASREDPSGERGTGAASSCQPSGQYLWGPDHGLDGERGHHRSQVRQPLFVSSPLLPEVVSLARETLTMAGPKAPEAWVFCEDSAGFSHLSSQREAISLAMRAGLASFSPPLATFLVATGNLPTRLTRKPPWIWLCLHSAGDCSFRLCPPTTFPAPHFVPV